MTCLEHLIENCLVKFEDKETRFDEIMKSIENDPNLQYAGITADQCYEICQYIYYSYVPYIIDKQCGADMEICDDVNNFQPVREDVEKAFNILLDKSKGVEE